MLLLLCFALGGALVLTGSVGLWEVLRGSSSPYWRHYMQRRKLRDVVVDGARNAAVLFVLAFVAVFTLSAAAVGVFEVLR